MTDEKPPLTTRRRRKWFIVAVILLCVATIPLWRSWQSGTSPLKFQAFDYKINAQTGFNSGCTTSSSQESRFACGRIAIVNRSGHPLLAQTGTELQARLKPLGYVRQIDYYPAGSSPEAGRLAEDITITLDLGDLQETPSLTSLGLNATILVEAGNQPASNTFSFDSSEMPSLVKFRFSGTLHHTSTTTGIGTPDTKYKLAAEDLAKKIAETLIKDFNEKYEKYGVLPDLPATFYPPYRPSPPLPLLEGHDAQKISACRGLFYSNHSRWRLAVDGDPAEILAAMQKRMEAAGWKTDSLAKAPLPPRLDLHRESTTVAIFEGTEAGLATTPPADGQAAVRPKRVFSVQYSDAMTPKQRDEAIDKLLAGRPSLDMLMLFKTTYGH